ncbi:unnamed protein product [Trifolium pratense]|uniref:Uncharacterized protein n=1 Tax=Trifolium pratense TaxID=57577 RepID=A0ACB0IZW2_TRIPR|nr:unnamed protein product [Trifolium pratense]
MLWFWLICQQKLLHDVMVSPPWRTAMVKDRENWFVLARTLLLVLMVVQNNTSHQCVYATYEPSLHIGIFLTKVFKRMEESVDIQLITSLKCGLTFLSSTNEMLPSGKIDLLRDLCVCVQKKHVESTKCLSN